jgi:hypothetical protein
VFRVRAGSRVTRHVVETGPTRAGMVEIRQGLAEGDLVVSRGHADLIDGSAVVARSPDGTPRSLPGGVASEPGVAAQ